MVKLFLGRFEYIIDIEKVLRHHKKEKKLEYQVQAVQNIPLR